jgi:predicted TIM-barrel fold metal-dependent hydrolase
MTQIIDFHTHVGSVVNKTVDDLLRSMDEAAIEKSVIIAGKTVVGLSNEDLVLILEKYPDRFLGILGAEFKEMKKFGKDYYELKKHIFNQSVIGCKFYCGYEHFYADEVSGIACYKDLLDLLNMFDKLAIFHCGDTYSVCKTASLRHAQPLRIDSLAIKYPELKIVMAHLGYPWHKDAAEVMYKNSNVYADISGFVYGGFTELDTRKFHKVLEDVNFILGENLFKERLLFGSDFPISNQKSYVDFIQKEINREFLHLQQDEFSYNILENTNKFVSSLLSM